MVLILVIYRQRKEVQMGVHHHLWSVGGGVDAFNCLNAQNMSKL